MDKEVAETFPIKPISFRSSKKLSGYLVRANIYPLLTKKLVHVVAAKKR